MSATSDRRAQLTGHTLHRVRELARDGYARLGRGFVALTYERATDGPILRDVSYRTLDDRAPPVGEIARAVRRYRPDREVVVATVWGGVAAVTVVPLFGD